MEKSRRRKFGNFLLGCLLFYIGAVAVLWIVQQKMVYWPNQRTITPAEMGMPDVQVVHAVTADGLTLEGWYAPPAKKGGRVFVLFHGNADHHALMSRFMAPHIAAGEGVLLTEYRGYAGNAGKPSEDGLYSDGRSWMDWLLRTGVRQQDIVLYGYSIGTGIATQMALEFPRVRALVLLAPFTSLPDVAKETYWFVPVDFLVHDKYENLAKIRDVRAPLLVMNGTEDKIVPPAEGIAVYRAATAPKALVQIPGAGHANVPPDVAFKHVEAFLDGIGRRAYGGGIVNDITQLNPIPVAGIATPSSVEEVSRLVADHNGPVCIGGGRYSQGGQIATDDCLFIDMRGMNRIVSLDAEKKRVTVQAGASWRQIQQAIDPEGLSLKIMQSYSNFTVGGSLSVNAHGRYAGAGPIIGAVESIKIVLADGSVKTASRTENPDLFYGAIGGYGGLGVIVEATLDLAADTRVERAVRTMDIKNYKDYFFREVAGDKTAVFHNADLYPPDFRTVRAVTWRATDKPATVKARLAPADKLTPFQQFLLARVSDGVLGKYLREYILDPLTYAHPAVEWRNYEASDDVAGLEPASREKATYVLQEYFIPVGNFDAFAAKMAAIFRAHHVNVLNVSIRHANADPGTLLAWARQEVFSFVVYYEQGVTDADKKEVRSWTGAMIDAALEEDGSYYLPYQIIATPDQFRRAYPQAAAYFALKKKVDPTYKFRNRLWDHYYEP